MITYDKHVRNYETLTEDKKRLVENNVHLVKFVAGRLAISYGHKVEFNELYGYGILGLIDAANKFDESKGVKFEIYASIRIRGEIMDALRKLDWIPRLTRVRVKEIENTINVLEQKLGRTTTDKEVANALGIDIEEYNKRLQEIHTYSLLSLEEMLEQKGEVLKDKGEDNPEAMLEKEEIRQILVKAIDGLEEKQRTVISLYYYDELTLKEIAKVLNVTKSRVSQIHTKAILRLKNKLARQLIS